MADRENVIRGIEHCKKYGALAWKDCNGHYEYTDDLSDIIKVNEHRHDCPYGKCKTGCVVTLVDDALELLMLKEYEVRELTKKEWYEWKANRNRDPICILWEHDTSPIWILNPNDVHEPAFLMGKLKLFNGKPTHEQCKAIKWD